MAGLGQLFRRLQNQADQITTRKMSVKWPESAKLRRKIADSRVRAIRTYNPGTNERTWPISRSGVATKIGQDPAAGWSFAFQILKTQGLDEPKLRLLPKWVLNGRPSGLLWGRI